jgi:hypothetical protein
MLYTLICNGMRKEVKKVYGEIKGENIRLIGPLGT